MSDISNLFDKLGIYIWVLAVGLIGGLLNIGQKKDKSAGHKLANLLIGTISSMFLGWISFEIALHFMQSERFALAICGFFAWKGAEWINIVVDKFIDSKLKKRDDDWFGYGRYDDMPPMPRNMKDEE